MRTALFVACLCAAACAKEGKDGKDQPAPADKPAPGEALPTPTGPVEPATAEVPVAGSGSAGAAAAPVPPQPTPPPPPSTTPPAAIDCGVLLTAADIATACGVPAGQVDVAKMAMETGKGATACLRRVTIKGDTAVQLAVNIGSASADAARRLLDVDRGRGATEVAVGDAGLLIVEDVAATRSTTHVVEAVKGAVWFKLFVDVRRSAKGAPPCSDDALVAVGKAIASRLP